MITFREKFFIKSVIIISIYSCHFGLVFCGNATVPHEVCEKYLSYEIHYTNTNTSVADSEFKDADFFLSQLQNRSDFNNGCNETIINITVIRSLQRLDEEVIVNYNVTVGVNEENRTNYASLDLATGKKIEECFNTLKIDILSPPAVEKFRLSFELPTHSSDTFRGELDDFYRTNRQCDLRILSCPPGSEEIIKLCECSRGRHLNARLKACTECPKDSYQEMTGMFNCTPCEIGFTTLKTGSMNRTDCKQDIPTSTKTTTTLQLPLCTKGEYFNTTSKICLPCPTGTYQNIPNSTSCKQCPKGQVTSGSGSKQLSSCEDESGTDAIKTLAIGLSIGLIVAALVALVIVLACRRKLNKEKKDRDEFVRTFTGIDEQSQDVEANDKPKTKTTENPHYIEENELSILGHLEDEVQSRNLEIPRDCITVTRVRLGRGQFGEVRQVLVRRPNEPEILCAAKSARGSRAVDDEMIEELEIHLKLEEAHDNVVNLIGICSTTGGPFYLIVEYCANGSLIEYLRKHQEASEYVNIPSLEALTTEWKLKRTLEICNGMKYLASNKIVHRDLAARNVLLDSNTVAKICDFGMAKDVYLKSYYKQQTEGSFPLRWMAIESIKTLQFNEQTDVWSFGILVWEIFTEGMLPYYDIISDEKVALYILKDKKLKRPEKCPKFLYSIMLKCWSYKGYNRPKFREIYESLSQNTEKQEKSGMGRRRLSRGMLKRLSETKRSLKRRMSRKGSRHSIDSTDSRASGSRKPSLATSDRHSHDIELPIRNAFFNPEAVEENDVEANSQEEDVPEENQNIDKVESGKEEQMCQKYAFGNDDTSGKISDVEEDAFPEQVMAQDSTASRNDDLKQNNDVDNIENFEISSSTTDNNTSNEKRNLSPNINEGNDSADNDDLDDEKKPKIHKNDLQNSECGILPYESTPNDESCPTTGEKINDSLPAKSLSQRNNEIRKEQEDDNDGQSASNLENVDSFDTLKSDDGEHITDGSDDSPNDYSDFLLVQDEAEMHNPEKSSSC